MSPQLKEIVAGVLGVSADQISETSGPRTIPEWNSLAHVTMVAAVEQEFSVQFEMQEILGIKTVADLSRLLTAKGGPG
jgi:acyl carrier protein